MKLAAFLSVAACACAPTFARESSVGVSELGAVGVNAQVDAKGAPVPIGEFLNQIKGIVTKAGIEFRTNRF